MAGRNRKTMPRVAVFLDRDGTLIDDVPYLSDPAKVRLLPEVPEALRLLASAGYRLIVVTNQSGIGRGYYTEHDMHRVNDEMIRQMSESGLYLDGLYYCPVAPGSGGRSGGEDPRRKPGPGMLLEAAQDLHLDLARSWMVGDMISDVQAGENAGCQGSILLRRPGSSRLEETQGHPGASAANLLEAARMILDAASRATPVPSASPGPS